MLRPAISSFRTHARTAVNKSLNWGPSDTATVPWHVQKGNIKCPVPCRTTHELTFAFGPEISTNWRRPQNEIPARVIVRAEWCDAVSLLCSVTPCPCCAVWRRVLAVLCDAVSLLYCVTPCPCYTLWRRVLAVLCDAVSLLYSVTPCPCCTLWRRVLAILCDAVSLLFCVTPCPFCDLWRRVHAVICDAVSLLFRVTPCLCCALWLRVLAVICDAVFLLFCVTPCPCCALCRRVFVTPCPCCAVWRRVSVLRIVLHYGRTEPPSNRQTHVTPHRNVPFRAVSSASSQPGRQFTQYSQCWHALSL